MERDRNQLLLKAFKELNQQINHHHRRGSSVPPLAVNRVKVTFKDEPGEGSGVARSFYTSIAEVSNLLSLFYYFYAIQNRFHSYDFVKFNNVSGYIIK